jgi:hypothetical protein
MYSARPFARSASGNTSIEPPVRWGPLDAVGIGLRVLACLRRNCLCDLVQVREVHPGADFWVCLEQTVSGRGERSGRGLSYRPAILVADAL